MFTHTKLEDKIKNQTIRMTLDIKPLTKKNSNVKLFKHDHTGWKIKDNVRKFGRQDNMEEDLVRNQDKSRKEIFRIYSEDEEQD